MLGSSGNVELSLIVSTRDEIGIEESGAHDTEVDERGALERASRAYAEELNAVYQQFARRALIGASQWARIPPRSTRMRWLWSWLSQTTRLLVV
jgi:hypothetical protein